MNSLSLLMLAVFAPMLVGLVSLVLPRQAVSMRVLLAIFGPLISLACLGLQVWHHGTTGPVAGMEWMPSLELNFAFNPDKLGLFFAFLVASFGVPIVLYARAYFGPDKNALYRLYPILMLFMTGMLGLVLADNLILLLLFWELTSISSFLLIGWERDDPVAVKKAMQAFIVTGAGGLALLGGLVLLGITTQAWSFSELTKVQGLTGGAITGALVLIFLGAAAKSAQWPLHFWLPGAMAAPTPISAYLHSATMVKAGVYLMGRLVDPLSSVDIWPYLLVPIGTITMVLGAYVALRKTDLKLIFAYTTVSQLGLLICMYGVSGFKYNGQPALLWDVTQIFSHALYKAPLFILAGAIAHTAYSRDLRDLYGLFYQGGKERLLVILLLLAAYAMAAGPLTLSFTAKEFFLYGVYDGYKASQNPMLIVVLAATVCQSALNVAIFFRLGMSLLGTGRAGALAPPTPDPQAEEGHVAFEDYHALQSGFWAQMLWLPAAIIVSLQYVGGIAPSVFDFAFGGLERNRGDYTTLPGLWYAVTHLSVPLVLSGSAMLIGTGLAFVPGRLGLKPIWRNTIQDYHERLFPWFYKLVTVGGGRLFGMFQTGDLRAYLGMICGTLVVLVTWAVFQSGTAPELSRRTLGDAPMLSYAPIYALGTLVCVSALMMPFVPHRGGRLMVLGTVGFCVAGLFYLYGAPDVALTQVAIEIVALILFLLALALLPRTKQAKASRPAVQLPRLALSICVGVVMGWLVMSSTLEDRPPMSVTSKDGRTFDHLGEFFLRNSYIGQDVPDRHPGGGGNNVVNVILVDFRAVDTLGEIVVLAIAALGVTVLLYRRVRPASNTDLAVATESSHAAHDDGTRPLQSVATPVPESTEPQAAASLPAVARSAVNRPHATGLSRKAARGPSIRNWRHGYSLTSEPIRVTTKLLVPLSLMFAGYLFLKGHQSPGGGFVAGLVAAVALTAHRMAHGGSSLRHLLRVKERNLIGVGLLIALATGVAPMLMGLPFMTTRYGYLTIPGTDQQVEWATAMCFDLGVFLVVLGVVQMMINALFEQAEAA